MLVVLLVSVFTTRYIPLLLTNKNMLSYMIKICSYLHEYIYIYIYIYYPTRELMVMIIDLHLVMLTYYSWLTIVCFTLWLHSAICYVGQPMANRRCHTKRCLELQNNAISHMTFLVWLTHQLGLCWCLSVLQSIWFSNYMAWSCSYRVPILYSCTIVFYILYTQLFGGVICFHAIMFIVLCLLLLFCIGCYVLW